MGEATTMSPTIPTVILGGSDGKPSHLPEAGKDHHPFVGYKGVDLRIGGRPIVAHIVERLLASGGFGPIAIAGPARLYREAAPDADILDVDGPVAFNLRAAVDDFLAKHSEGPVAIMACDVLPDPAELEQLLELYETERECDVWFPMVRVPDDPDNLRAFRWKPRYCIAPNEQSQPVPILPGHLIVADPRAMRLPLLYHLLDVAYRTRNCGVGKRKRSMVRAVLFELFYQDLRHVLGLRLPVITWTVLRSGLRIARRLRAGGISRGDLEREIGRVLLKTRHRAAHPERGARFPITDAISLAEDIDTHEEATQAETWWRESAEHSRLEGHP